MSQLDSGAYNIVSLTDGTPTTSISGIVFSGDDIGPDFQYVSFGQDIHAWLLTKQADDQIYQLRIGKYPWTGVREDKVITTDIRPELDVKWHITYQPAQDAYTIEPNDDRSKAWTVTHGDINYDSVIEIKPLVELGGFLPEFSPTQLFRFVKQ